jgi:peptide/nickel transport system permease protein
MCARGESSFWHYFKKSKVGMFGLVIFLAFIFVALAGPFVSPYDPSSISSDFFSPPSFTHLLGTDHLGRDVLSRVISGTRISLMVGLVAAGLAAIIGILSGAVSGYYGGFVDESIARFTDIFLILPTFFLLIIVNALLGANIYLIMVIIGLTSWPSNARIMRSQVLSRKNWGFVKAAVGIGSSKLRVIFFHIVPNSINPIITNSTVRIAWAILTEASISFIGLGDANFISWGRIIYQGQTHILSAWWIAFFPGMAMFVLILGLNFLADGINHALSPRLRGM